MAKAAKKNTTANGGSSSPKGKNGNGGNGKAAAHDAGKQPAAPAPGPVPSAAVEQPAEKKRKGRAPTEGEPLKRVLIFLSDDDLAGWTISVRCLLGMKRGSFGQKAIHKEATMLINEAVERF